MAATDPSACDRNTPRDGATMAQGGWPFLTEKGCFFCMFRSRPGCCRSSSRWS